MVVEQLKRSAGNCLKNNLNFVEEAVAEVVEKKV